MTILVVRKVTSDDYELLEERAAAFIERHDLRSEICGIKAGDPLISDYSALEDYIWLACNYTSYQVYYRKLWTRIFQRATGTDGHYIAYGYIVHR